MTHEKPLVNCRLESLTLDARFFPVTRATRAAVNVGRMGSQVAAARSLLHERRPSSLIIHTGRTYDKNRLDNIFEDGFTHRKLVESIFWFVYNTKRIICL